MARPMRVLKLAAGLLAGLLVLWFEAVRRLPEVRRRKARRRSARLSKS